MQKEREERKTARTLKSVIEGTPGGNADHYKNKGLTGKAIRKTMKTKGRQNKAHHLVHACYLFDGRKRERATPVARLGERLEQPSVS